MWIFLCAAVLHAHPAALYAPKTDAMMARHLLRRQPEPTAAAADRIPDIEAVVANAPGVDDCCAFIREDTIGVPLVRGRLPHMQRIIKCRRCRYQ